MFVFPTGYISKATPAYFAYAKTVLRYHIGVKGRQFTWCGSPVSSTHVLDEILAFVDPSWVDDKNTVTGEALLLTACSSFMRLFRGMLLLLKSLH